MFHLRSSGGLGEQLDSFPSGGVYLEGWEDGRREGSSDWRKGDIPVEMKAFVRMPPSIVGVDATQVRNLGDFAFLWLPAGTCRLFSFCPTLRQQQRVWKAPPSPPKNSVCCVSFGLWVQTSLFWCLLEGTRFLKFVIHICGVFSEWMNPFLVPSKQQTGSGTLKKLASWVLLQPGSGSELFFWILLFGLMLSLSLYL